MDSNKILGYPITAIGIIVVLLSFEQLQKALKITFPTYLTTNILTIIGIVILAIGAFFMIKIKSGKKMTEVPIYHEDKIVGYRRMHNK